MSQSRVVNCVGKAHRSEQELDNLIQDIKRCDLLSGDSNLIDEYESALAGYFNMPYAISVTSGTAALHASLAETIQPGDEVLIPVIGVTMTASAVIMAGGIPVFYDCQPDSFKPDFRSLEAVSGPKTRVLITVSMWGYPALDDDILSFALKKNWLVMEDTAQGFGTQHQGSLEGTKGHIGCFSTQEFKLISTGEGGFIVTRDQDYAQNIRQFTRIGFSQKHRSFGFHGGLNYRLSAMQASLGISQLAMADDKIALRNQKVALWRASLGLKQTDVNDQHPLQLFNRDGLAGHNGYALALRMTKAGPDEAKLVLNKLFEAGVCTDIHRYQQSLLVNYAYLQPYYQSSIYRQNPREDFPNAAYIMDGLIPLPCHDAVSLDDIQWAAERVISKAIFAHA